MRTELTAEATLEASIRQQVADIKEQYACWQDPEALCIAMGIRVVYGNLGLGREGAAIADAIQLDPTAGVPARRQFTFYHEIVHHLLRSHQELYSIINDQYVKNETFHAISERLCNVGAAEFLLPRDRVRAAIEDEGFSVTLIERLHQPDRVSRVAACAQLAFCAPHQCIAVVCRHAPPHMAMDAPLPIADVVDLEQVALVISCAFRPAHTKYSCATGSTLPGGHLLTSMITMAHGERVRARAPIPFRSQKRWEVDCECVRLGEQVFGFFHLEDPPVSLRGQLHLW